jgi:hypothetical protein
MPARIAATAASLLIKRRISPPFSGKFISVRCDRTRFEKPASSPRSEIIEPAIDKQPEAGAAEQRDRTMKMKAVLCPSQSRGRFRYLGIPFRRTDHGRLSRMSVIHGTVHPGAKA